MTERLRARQTVVLADVPAGSADAALAHLGVLVDRLLEPGSPAYETKDPTVDLTSLVRSGLIGFREFLTEARALLAGSAPAGAASGSDHTRIEVPVDLTAEAAAPELLAELLAELALAPGFEAGPVAGWMVEEIANQLRGATPRPWTA